VKGERQNRAKSRCRIEFCFTERWSGNDESNSTVGYIFKTGNSEKMQLFSVNSNTKSSKQCEE